MPLIRSESLTYEPRNTHQSVVDEVIFDDIEIEFEDEDEIVIEFPIYTTKTMYGAAAA